MKTRDLIAFLGLAIAWGSSFLWIKIAVAEIEPFTLVALRLLFGALGLAVVVAIGRPPLPKSRAEWATLAVLGVTNTAAPFVLITWGEQFIDSAVASVYNSTVPLFTVLIAHVFLREERFSALRMLGVAIGFLGVVVIFARDLVEGAQLGLLGQGAVLAAAMLYGGSAVLARRNTKGLDRRVIALAPLIVADVVVWGGAVSLENPIQLPQLPITWIAIVWLGVIGSFIAYLLYFHLVHNIGPTRAAMVTYTFPVTGLLLGAIFLSEHLTPNLIGGSALVLASLLIVNRARR